MSADLIPDEDLTEEAQRKLSELINENFSQLVEALNGEFPKVLEDALDLHRFLVYTWERGREWTTGDAQKLARFLEFNVPQVQFFPLLDVHVSKWAETVADDMLFK